MSSSREEAIDANPPFSGHTEDGDAPADLILRATVDGAVSVDFYVHKGLLSVVSEVFRDMFEMVDDTSHPAEIKDVKTVVPVFDCSAALEILLHLCYPFPGNFQPATLHGVEGAIAAAEKYQIKRAVAVLRGVLMNFVDTEPYAVFGIALRRKAAQAVPENIAAMETIVNTAALATLKAPFLARIEDLAASSQAHLLQLHAFRTICGNAAANIAVRPTSWVFFDDLPSTPPTDRTKFAAVWWWSGVHGDECGFIDHMLQVSEALKISPTEQQIRERLLDMRGTMYRLSKCPQCAGKAIADLNGLVLDDLVNDVVAHNLTV
ncbi:hypothetical protein C8R47DRAFT_1095062 [Mycena vitilis]|nr:hypothetical protein C8R47DRAFT_1095062 [Mycena vitilis]